MRGPEVKKSRRIHYKEYYERIDAVTKEDVLRLAREYLDINKAAIVITRPGESSSESELNE